ncbi:DUF3696 domain-containing protein [Aeromonas hydrophila]|uniref:DUF3696 domain-containing protein n=1 Tax=Aeromonas hydrophila TaxID=644 RepID=UPI0022AF1137|nr:DUF3696 domain-containing protein [Aeromonas hydrophila]ELB2790485.1 DUF3696 domain-containing protein [Aeromonas hydrophila]MCZ4332251.1 DUF3696 domain-containing protein [Aeromonas hydrophila]
MIDRITLVNFKCFSELDIALSPLTILTGCNSSGKSTIIQSLCLVKQNISLSEEPRDFFLNGSQVNLGEYTDVINYNSAIKEFSIKMTSNDGENEIEWRLQRNEGNPRIAQLIGHVDYQEPSLLIKQLSKMTRVSSERVGPLDIYPTPEEFDLNVGIDGRYVAAYIDSKNGYRLTAGHRANSQNTNYLTVLNELLGSFFPNYKVDISRIDGTSYFKLRFFNTLLGKDIKPYNVGFGVSNVLPILASGLGACNGDILIIENPELHLHPKAQSLLSDFISKVVADGVQVIIETHSDHIINGFRKAVKNNLIKNTDVATYFFDNKKPLSHDVSDNVKKLAISESGDYEQWPSGFFDQIENDMKSLLGW